MQNRKPMLYIIREKGNCRVHKITQVAGDWETLRQELYTPEEIALCDYQVALIWKLVKARDTGRIIQAEYDLLFEAAQAAMDKTLNAERMIGWIGAKSARRTRSFSDRWK